MKIDNTKIILNIRGIITMFTMVLLTGIVIGFVVSKELGNDGITFSRDELERIIQLQTMEDESMSGANIIAYKDKDGNLMISWELNKSKR